MSSLKSKLDQALKLVLIFALVYILAVASYLNHIPPAPFIAQGVKQLYAQLLRWFPKDVYQTDLWRFADHEKRGVTRHDGTKAKAGYTLYSAGNETSVLLVDMEGELLHKWQKNFHDVWDESAAIKQPIDEKYIVVRDTHLYANGDLLILYSAWGDMPWGYGIVKLDKDSNIIWKRLEHYHHDLHVDSDGRIYTLEHEIQQQQPEGLTHFPEPFYLDDFVVVLSPDGEVEERISILDAFRTDGFANIHSPAVGLTGQNVQFNVEFEILHANAVRPISEDVASKLPFASPGDLLLSLRNLDALAVLNRKSEKLTWFNRGPWVAQHDPDFDEAGNIILFDNLGDYASGGARIIKYNPLTSEVLWSFSQTEDEPFISPRCGSQQELPGGNVLVTEFYRGRLFEVTPAKEIVWEYYVPVRDEKTGEMIPAIYNAKRYFPNELQFQFKHGNSN